MLLPTSSGLAISCPSLDSAGQIPIYNRFERKARDFDAAASRPAAIRVLLAGLDYDRMERNSELRGL